MADNLRNLWCVALLSAALCSPAQAQSQRGVLERLGEVDAGVWFAAGYDLLQAGNFSGAGEMFWQGVTTEPTNGLGHFYLAESVERGRLPLPADLTLFHYVQAARYLPSGAEKQRALARAAELLTLVQRDAAATRTRDGLQRRPPQRYEPARARYDGEWKGGVPHGRGIFVYDDGRRYEGEVRDGRPDGYGTESWRRSLVTPGDLQQIYAGEWRDGERHGRGRQINRHATQKQFSNIYVGDFAGGIANGSGERVTGGGLVQRGRFVDGRLEGPGTEIRPDGTVRSGEWKAGDLVKAR